ncbi:MAG: RNA polymerase sigma factor [Alphaproteobacteria bacterium]|nr:RNA polymerase sigma factor [Alphaproteobacteria bacterium]
MAEIVNLAHRSDLARPSAALWATDATALSPPPDALALLLAETAKGDERAFARLYELTGGRLLAVARGILGAADAAEDALQESFIRVWRSAHRYDPAKGAAYAWLVTVVRNRALSLKMTQRRREGGTGLDSEGLAFDGPDACSLMMRSEAARCVKACLEKLPINHRRSVTLVYFEGLTHRELAGRLDVQLGTAKSWVRRGLAQMGRCLAGHDNADWRDLVAAEYAIGSLRGAARRGFERRRERDARYCGAADRWEGQLALLAECLPDHGLPPARVWNRIADGTGRRSALLGHAGAWWAAAAAAVALASLLAVVV